MKKIICVFAIICFLAVSIPQMQKHTLASTEVKSTNISIGHDQYLSLSEDGTVWEWEEDYSGLFNGVEDRLFKPKKIKELNGVIGIEAGYEFSMALKDDGTVWAWGQNSSGQLGDGSLEERPFPAQVKGLSDVKEISIYRGGTHTLALKNDGTVWAWGSNHNGQIGDSTQDERHIPVQVSGLRNVVSISAGDDYSLALKEDGTVWGWGSNYGKLGQDTSEYQLTPIQIYGLNNVVGLSAGEDDSLALKRDGTVWGWGRYFQNNPVQIQGLSNVQNISMGERHYMVITEDGRVWGGGSNAFGFQSGPAASWYQPVLISTVENITSVSSGFYYESLFLNSSGQVFIMNDKGEIEVLSLKVEEKGERKENSKEDILRKWLTYKPIFTGEKYLVKPNVQSPYSAGVLNPGFLNDGINMANFVRYLAGLPDNLILDKDLTSQAQHGAALLAATNKLTHYPNKPADMSESFYELGALSTRTSNLGMGYSSISQSIKEGYMRDEDSSNIDRVGHRRWILNPPLKKLGFGYANNFTSMQVFDKSQQEYFDYEYIAWPNSGYFPTEFLDEADPWSISLNPELYKSPVLSSVEVKLIRKSDNKSWEFDQSDLVISKDQDFLNVDTSCYGICNSIIFRPGNVDKGFKENEEFQVIITGVNDYKGEPSKIEYEVQLFHLFGLDVTQYHDYQAGEYWSEHMAWSIENGLIKGYWNQRHPSTGRVGNWINPYGTLTESQFLTILFRYMYPEEFDSTKPSTSFWATIPYQLAEKYHLPTKGSLVYQEPASEGITRGTMARIFASLHFKKQVSEREAIQWMYDKGISTGYADSLGKYPKTYESFKPKDQLKRAQIVSFVKRYDEVKK